MYYVGRIFFHVETKEVIYFYEMQGNIIINSIADDVLSVPSLSQVPANLIGVFELEKTDIETREKARTATSMRLVNGEILFDFT